MSWAGADLSGTDRELAGLCELGEGGAAPTSKLQSRTGAVAQVRRRSCSGPATGDRGSRSVRKGFLNTGDAQMARE